MKSSNLVLVGNQDRLFEVGPYPKPFEFNAAVADVFDDMVTRSIPIYRDALDCLLEWARRHVTAATRIYDVGCSTGTTLEALGRAIETPVELVGIDTSEPMLDKAREKLAGISSGHQARLIHDDALHIDFNNASLVVMNYTLHFLPVKKRLELLRNIHGGLVEGGLLFLSDKVRSACPEFQETVTDIYEQFKLSRGYSRNEIERKKEALEHVLVPLTQAEQAELVQEAGFDFCEPVIMWNNFMSLVAIKR